MPPAVATGCAATGGEPTGEPSLRMIGAATPVPVEPVPLRPGGNVTDTGNGTVTMRIDPAESGGGSINPSATEPVVAAGGGKTDVPIGARIPGAPVPIPDPLMPAALDA